jgi:hypothetical protein
VSVIRNRAVWLPAALTLIFAASDLAPISPSLFELHLERISSIGAPVFIVFQQLDLVDLLPLHNGLRSTLQCALLVFYALCWFTFILLPFWSDFRLRDCSLGRTRFLFALFGIVITAVAWIGLGGWRVHDE